MELELKSTNEELIKKFWALKNRKDVSDMLEIPEKVLIYYLYVIPAKRNYNIFFIRKKSGGEREIKSPKSSLKIIQRKLSKILYLAYKQKPSAHGFCLNRDIKTNAKVHLHKKLILNIDLKDFFKTIIFRRVRGMFLGKPYNFNKEVSTVLAQLCCDDYLPQGAPTSPIVSNMLCSRMDTCLQRFAGENFCDYTRYVDDITFSSTRNKFKEEVVIKSAEGYNLSKKLIKLIEEDNGFDINNEKTRVRKKTERMEVTGLVVNKKININRAYLKKIRAILFDWEKNGIDKATDNYIQKNIINKKTGIVYLEQIVLGRINFVKQIRGHEDDIYRKLINKFNECKRRAQRLPLSTEVVKKSVWVIEVEKSNGEISQGTCFYLQNYGFITCSHVVKDAKKIALYNSEDNVHKQDARIVRDGEVKNIDLAIVEIIGKEKENFTFLQRSDNEKFYIDEEFTLFGFPQHNGYKEPSKIKTRVTNFAEYKECEIFNIDKNIIKGHSGSPLVNEHRKVVGVAFLGAENYIAGLAEYGFSVLPIRYIDDI